MFNPGRIIEDGSRKKLLIYQNDAILRLVQIELSHACSALVDPITEFNLESAVGKRIGSARGSCDG
jgi:hypothetical protein